MPRSAPPRKKRHTTLTSLIDVVFLLLLFFMLSSTFTHHAEIPLVAATGGAAAAPGTPPIFLRLGADEVLLNGREVALDGLVQRIEALPQHGPAQVLVSLDPGVDAQRLADCLLALAGLSVTVLG